MQKFNLEKKTIANKYYRKVVHTDHNIQLVLMCLNPGEIIPMEKHKTTTQFFRIETGHATAEVGSSKYTLKDGDTLIVPPNTMHRIKQVGDKPLKLYTIYSPPQHRPNTINKRQPDDD